MLRGPTSLFLSTICACIAAWAVVVAQPLGAQQGPTRAAQDAVSAFTPAQAARLLHSSPAVAPSEPGEDPHAAVFQESMYPSANECAGCHEEIYNEWSSSSHAYASISPMFHRFEQTINDLSGGTIG